MHSPHITTCTSCNLCFARNDSVFNTLTAQELQELEDAKTYVSFGDGELIFKERQRPFGIYIIQEGKVKISKHGYEGREYIVRFAKSGHIIGYRSFFYGEPYSCSATAISEALLCFVPGNIILDLIGRNSGLALQFMKHLAQDLKTAEEKAISIAHKPVRERVAESIITLKDVYGFEQDNNIIDVSLKRDEIAGIAGASRETVTRILSELNEEKIVLLEGRKIRILDPEKLQAIAFRSF